MRSSKHGNGFTKFPLKHKDTPITNVMIAPVVALPLLSIQGGSTPTEGVVRRLLTFYHILSDTPD